MTTYDNGEPLADWVPQPGRHCGEICLDWICPVCKMPADPMPIAAPIDDWPYSLMTGLGDN